MNERPHFDVTAAVIRQLGDELISDEVTALLELVKNAYDADATVATVIVQPSSPGLTETEAAEDRVASAQPETTEVDQTPQNRGLVTIEDNGTGMDESDIREKWLRISLSEKRQMKRRGETTPKHKRTPLGDKGLGRLSVQRLGSRIRLVTLKEYIPPDYPKSPAILAEAGVQVDVNWHHFSENLPLGSVPVSVESLDPGVARRGTRLEIADLRNPEVWEGDARDVLVTRLTQLVSPFAQDREFRIHLKIGDDTYDFEKIAGKVRRAALSTHAISYTENRLRIIGKLKLGVFRGTDPEEVYARMLLSDQGASFFKYLTRNGRLPVPGLQQSPSGDWYLEYAMDIDVSDVPGLEHEEISSQPNGAPVQGTPEGQSVRPSPGGDVEAHEINRLYDPGPFQGEIDQFSYEEEPESAGIAEVFSRTASYRAYIRAHAGVRLYRNGFGIRPYGLEGQDWLNLQSGQTSGSSYYGLRPRNVIGYIDISAERNPYLQEKTDREGLIDTPITRNFMALCRYAAGRINSVFSTLRRDYNSYKKTRHAEHLGVSSSDEALGQLRRLATVRPVEPPTAHIDRLSLALGSLSSVVADSRRGSSDPKEFTEKVEGVVHTLAAEISALQQPVHGLAELLQHSHRFGDTATFLGDEIATIRVQLREFAELAGLGLTVEAFTHNLSDTVARLSNETGQLRRSMRSGTVSAARLAGYVDYVRSTTVDLRRQLRRLAPSLRYQRDVRDAIQLESYFQDVRRYYLDTRKLESEGFSFSLEQPFDDFAIRMNRGRFTQVVDTLLLNSEYWLRELVRKGSLRDPTFFVASKKPNVRIWDNGPGIDPTIESMLFQPFATTKPKGGGRGLGLFIARQLLDAEGCELHLLPTRNSRGRRFIFELNLQGAIDGD